MIDCVATFLTTRRELGGTTTTTATSDAVLEGLVAVQNLCAQEEDGVLFVLRDETILDTLFYLWGSCKRVGTKKGMEIQRSVQSIVEALEFAAIRRNISYPVERFHTILNKKKRFSLE